MKTKQLIIKLLNSVKAKSKLFLLLTIFSSSLNINSNSDFTLEQEMKLRSFIEQFLDKNVEPNKPFEVWLQDLKELLQGAPKFNQYCIAISDIEKSRNILDAGKNFEKFKNLIPENLKNFFQAKYNKAAILKNLTERLKKRIK